LPGLIVNRRLQVSAAVVFIISASVIPRDTAHAGPCAAEIDQMEAAMNALAPNKEIGSAHQSRAADLHRQPTPGSVARGREQAAADERHDRAALERARAADARGDKAACTEALSEARRRRSAH